MMWTLESAPYLTPQAAGSADAWSVEAAAAGRRPGQVIREAGLAVPPDEIASELSIKPGTEAVVRRRTIAQDGITVELSDSWFPAQVAAGTALAAPGKIKGGAVTLLVALGYVVHEAREDISARASTPDEAALLGVPSGSPVLVLARTSLTADGVPFEAAVMVMREVRHLRQRLIADAA